jgi:amino acid transporter
VNMTATCLAMSIVVCLLALVRLRRIDRREASFRVPRGVLVCALAAALTMVGVAVIAPFVRTPGVFPTEWKLIAVWGAVGSVAARIAVRQSRHKGDQCHDAPHPGFDAPSARD